MIREEQIEQIGLIQHLKDFGLTIARTVLRGLWSELAWRRWSSRGSATRRPAPATAHSHRDFRGKSSSQETLNVEFNEFTCFRIVLTVQIFFFLQHQRVSARDGCT